MSAANAKDQVKALEHEQMDRLTEAHGLIAQREALHKGLVYFPNHRGTITQHIDDIEARFNQLRKGSRHGMALMKTVIEDLPFSPDQAELMANYVLFIEGRQLPALPPLPKGELPKSHRQGRG